jgi:DNA-binding transcriptional LysR family regulator
MKFPQVRYFLNLADTLNFTEAAMRSGVSQPTLTRAIQQLEQELGGRLIFRDGKDTRLTALGRDIQAEFAGILEIEQRVRALSRSRIRGRRETLTIGVAHTIAPAPITKFIAHALRQLPMLELIIRPIARDRASELLLAGQIDGCFTSDAMIGNPKLATAKMFTERLLLAMAEQHPFVQASEVSFEQFLTQPYLDRLHCEFRAQVIALIRDHARTMVPRLRSEREDLIQQAVADGAGVCMLPEFSAIVEGIVLRPVRGIELVRSVSFQSVSGSATAMALRQLRMLVEQFAWHGAGESMRRS